MHGLPDGIRACLFDLDGVLTQTAKVHAQAWKETFDAFLRDREGDGFQPFRLPEDYEAYVDGKPRLDGVRSFLEARGIPLADDVVKAIGDRKNARVLELIRTQGVEAFADSVDYVRAVRADGVPCAVVSSSANTRDVLAAVGITDLFQAVVDGVVAAQEDLPGKPAPDTFLAGAQRLGVTAPEAAVFEDAVAGVQAGAAGGFGFVVGVDRTDHAQALRDGGADVVVRDLSELTARP